MKPIPVVYLAHPVGAPTPDGVAANLASARKWLAVLIEACPDVAWCVPWLPYLDVLEDSAENRTRGLRDDCEVAKRCDAILMVGPRVSDGMQLEAEAASEVIDCTGMFSVDVVGVVNGWVRR